MQNCFSIKSSDKFILIGIVITVTTEELKVQYFRIQENLSCDRKKIFINNFYLLKINRML